MTNSRLSNIQSKNIKLLLLNGKTIIHASKNLDIPQLHYFVPKALHAFDISHSFWRTFLLIVLISLLTVNISANASNTFDQRYSTSNEKTRVVFEFSEKVGFSWKTIDNSSEIILTIVNPNDVERLTSNNNFVLSSIHIKTLEYRHENESNNLEIVFQLKNNPNVTVFDLLPSINSSHRVIVDLFTTLNPVQTSILSNQKSNTKSDSQQLHKISKLEPEPVLSTNNKVTEYSQTVTFTPIAKSLNSVESSVVQTSRSEVLKKNDFVVVIDPGHGGVDLGSSGPNNTFEKDLTLSIANDLHKKLNNIKNVRATLTRSKDVYLNPRKRSEIAEYLGADMLISLHADAHGTNEIQQISVWSYQSSETSSTVGQDLIQAESEAVLLGNKAGLSNNVSQDNMANGRNVAFVKANKVLRSNKIASILSTNLNSKFKQVAPSAQQANFITLAGKNVPSILVNFGYLLNNSIIPENDIPEQDRDLSKVKNKLFEAVVATINEYSMIPERGFYRHNYQLQASQQEHVGKTKDLNESVIIEPPVSVKVSKTEFLVEGSFQTHIVSKGDSLYQISKKYKTSIAILKQKNKLLTHSIRIGQLILVPTPNSV